jgi:hypothetical protein
MGLTEMSGGDLAATIVIEGVDDPAVVAEIQNVLRAVCRDVAPERRVTVALAPGDTRGRWDLAVKVSSGRHLTSFVGPRARLAEIAAQHLRRLLERVAGRL